MPAVTRSRLRDERGVAMVLFAVIIPLTFLFAAVVWDVGNWWVHRKHLQTKVDAAAFAGGASWGFPCGSDSDTNAIGTGIVDQAREYVGPHMGPGNQDFTGGVRYNPQVGGTPGTNIHVVLNGNNWWDDDASLDPADKTSPNNASICNSSTLDVKATEANNTPLFGWLPFFPDIKRKARVEIREIEGLRGLLPIAVRVPKPLSAAAVFYNEENGDILDGGAAVKFFCEKSSIFGLPAGLGGWTTYDTLDPACSYTSWAQFHIAQNTGIVIATSFRPRCGAPGATGPCMSGTGFTTVNALCNQGNVQCFDASGNPQNVRAGLHFIRGYPTGTVTDGPPALRTAYLTQSGSCAGYFNSVPSSCTALLNATIDLGDVIKPPPPPGGTQTRTAGNTEVRYRIVSDAGNFCAFNNPQCDLNGAGGPGNSSWTTTNTIPAFITSSARNAFAIRVRMKNTTVAGSPGCSFTLNNFNANCEFFFTGNGLVGNAPSDAAVLAAPVQRSFMGDNDLSGAVKWLRLTTDANVPCDTFTDIDGPAASQTIGADHCFYLDMGLQGGLAKDQDEPPLALNLGTGSSQRALLDCDPNIPNIKSEVVSGCQDPAYTANKFDPPPFCPGTSQFFTTPKASPFNDWPPFDCVLTQTSNAVNQLIEGLEERLYGPGSNPVCPTDPGNTTGTEWTAGRNYWHNANNMNDNYTFADDKNTATTVDDLSNRIKDDDPRLVNLFFTPYDSFTGPGNEVYPVVGFGSFYITGWGRTSGGGFQAGSTDPCTDGNSGAFDGLPYGVGSEPPPDLSYVSNTTYVWGHFVKNVVPNPLSQGVSGILCNPQSSFLPCVAVLVE